MLSLVLSLSLTLGACAVAGDEDLAVLTARAEALRAEVESLRRAAGAYGLRINGEEVPPVAMMRSFVYLYGTKYLERKIRDFLVADELEFRRKAGNPLENLVVGTAEVAKEIDDLRGQLAERNPGKDPDALFRLLGFTLDELWSDQESWRLFDKVFLPDEPDEWPESTRQALASAGGQQFVDQIVDGLKKAKEADPTAPMPPFYRQLFRQWIQKELRKVSNVKMASGGIPPEIVLAVNDWTLPTEEAFRSVSPLVTPYDRERVLAWLLWTTATRQALKGEGAYASDEEFAVAFEEHEGPYKDSPLNIEMVATAFKKFPSYELYKEHFRIRKSYEKKIESEITDEALRSHLDRVRDFLGGGRVDAQVILLSARDWNDWSWKGPDAFEAARTRADEVMAALQKGESFEALLDRYSEFWTPAPGDPSQPQQQPQPNGGRFGLQEKNNLRTLLGETEFDTVLRGYSIADLLFHDTKVGEIVGPLRGPFGYYVARVVAKVPGHRGIDLAQENQRQLVREDYVNQRLLDWSNGVITKSSVELR